MPDPRFFARGPEMTLGEVAKLTGASMVSGADADKSITGVAPLAMAGENDVSFLIRAGLRPALERSAAGAVFVTQELGEMMQTRRNLLVVDDPQGAYATLARQLYPETVPEPTISAQAVIDPAARLGASVTVGPMAVIGARVEIGEGSVIGAGTVIADGVVIGPGARIGAQVFISHALIGARVSILPGARIGQAGFGYHPGPGGLVPIPQLGRVVIADDVDIGANTTIDRGAGDDTVIGTGTKIDNQVQIAHNCKIGAHCVITAQGGLAGSVTLGNAVQLGGQVGIADQRIIGNGARVAAKSGVNRNIPAGADYGGIPARDQHLHLRAIATLNRLARGSRPDRS